MQTRKFSETMDDSSSSDPALGARVAPRMARAHGFRPVELDVDDAPPPATDADLLIRMAQGDDRDAFAQLFGRYAVRVKAYLMRGGAAADVADETAQEVMVSVWRRAALYDPAKAGVSTWIFAIARNRRIDILRREIRATPDPDDPLFQPDAVDDPEAAAAAADRDAQVRDAMRDLPDDQRDVVRMAFFVGMTQAEMAEALDVPLGTIKSRMRLALGRLRAALGDDFAEELLHD